MVIWLIGMAGAGKTTLARALYARLRPAHPNFVLLDGDSVRDVFRDVDHTIEGRRRNAERLSGLCRLLDAQGIHVIAAVLSIFPEWQAWNREHFSRYFEVFLDLPLAELKRRDAKRLYERAEAGGISNVVGIDIPFPRPRNPDLVIGPEAQAAGIEACIGTILERMGPL